MGREEIDTVIPVLEELRAAGIDLLGPTACGYRIQSQGAG
jgi:4-hydroxy-L-threonine phosphate dehydrogenase PdxA